MRNTWRTLKKKKNKDVVIKMLKNSRTSFYKPFILKIFKNKVLSALFVARKNLRTLLSDQYYSTLSLLSFLYLLIKHLGI